MERRTTTQQSSATRQANTQAATQPAPIYQDRPPKHEGISRRRLLRPVLIVALIVILAGAGFASYRLTTASSSNLVGVDADRYQALFLNSGQVYFGKLSSADPQTVRLTDIYYLQVAQDVQPQEEAAPEGATTQEPQLIKLGEELHAPEDEMYVDRNQVSFWENLKDEGQVVQAIQQYSSR